MSAKEILVGGPMRPLISVGVHARQPEKFTVNCHACGNNAEFTGEGGYDTAEEAGVEAQNHRLSHLAGLVDEIKAADVNVRLT